MKVHIHQGTFKQAKGVESVPCLMLTTAPGLSDVIAILVFDDKGIPSVYKGEVWDYDINVYAKVEVASGAATLTVY